MDEVLSHGLGYNPDFRFWNRGYLPHIDAPLYAQMVTFRLADALPAAVVEEIKRRRADGDCRDVEAAWAEPWLDAGHGSCILNDPNDAEIVADVLLRGDGQHYALFAWVVMPNHVHVVFQPFANESLSCIMHAWKSASAHRIQNRRGQSGRLWQRGYFDRLIRNEVHLTRAIQYVEYNPVAADLVSASSAWAWSSAYIREAADPLASQAVGARPESWSQVTTSPMVSSAER